MAPSYTPSCTNGGGLKELEKLETSIENPVAYPSCARIVSKFSPCWSLQNFEVSQVFIMIAFPNQLVQT